VIKRIVPIEERPMCVVQGCSKQGQHTGRYKNNGYPIFRKTCTKHHSIKYGLHDWHYKIHRKEFCENVDGRLGFKCTTTIIDYEWQLDIDHKDGDPSNNVIKNLQTLCKCCHAIKTKTERDYMTPGRKTLKSDNSISDFFS
jgi:hypothetical protein